MTEYDYSDDRPVGEQIARVRERIHTINDVIAELRTKADHVPVLAVHIEMLQEAVRGLGSTVAEISKLSASRGATIEAALGHFAELRAKVELGTNGHDHNGALMAKIAEVEKELRAEMEKARTNAEDPIARQMIGQNDRKISALQTTERRVVYGLVGLLITIISALVGWLFSKG